MIELVRKKAEHERIKRAYRECLLLIIAWGAYTAYVISNNEMKFPAGAITSIIQAEFLVILGFIVKAERALREQIKALESVAEASQRVPATLPA